MNAISKLDDNSQTNLDNLFLRSQPTLNKDISGVSLNHSEASELSKQPINNNEDRLLQKICELEEENSLLQNDIKYLHEQHEEFQKKIDTLLGDIEKRKQEINLITKPVISYPIYSISYNIYYI